MISTRTKTWRNRDFTFGELRFEVDERHARLIDLGDQLEAFSRAVDFEQFRLDLEQALCYADGSKGGRPPLDPVMMFKALVIQTINTRCATHAFGSGRTHRISHR